MGLPRAPSLAGCRVPPGTPEYLPHACTRLQQSPESFQLQASLGSHGLSAASQFVYLLLPGDSARAWVGSYATSCPWMGWRKIC